ncbi:hypothetical protein EVAR_44045_1 [Eumeta japonica]|uniref:Uncharacterized protein n=1 Tax=Eumeta variegata TaxID=151549 RepID=A0A4C1XJ23_EUMVA|nr:hypothetical protein EVAR_44045_1 [Eumeta japonica]
MAHIPSPSEATDAKESTLFSNFRTNTTDINTIRFVSFAIPCPIPDHELRRAIYDTCIRTVRRYAHSPTRCRTPTPSPLLDDLSLPAAIGRTCRSGNDHSRFDSPMSDVVQDPTA